MALEGVTVTLFKIIVPYHLSIPTDFSTYIFFSFLQIWRKLIKKKSWYINVIFLLGVPENYD